MVLPASRGLLYTCEIASGSASPAQWQISRTGTVGALARSGERARSEGAKLLLSDHGRAAPIGPRCTRLRACGDTCWPGDLGSECLRLLRDRSPRY